MLETHPEYYINISMYIGKYNLCDSPAEMNSHVCACPRGMYLKEYDDWNRKFECSYLPDIFDQSTLKLDVGYTYDG